MASAKFAEGRERWGLGFEDVVGGGAVNSKASLKVLITVTSFPIES